MKTDDVDRLLRSAARAPGNPAPEAPFGFDTRVLAAWRAATGGTEEFADLSRFLRGAGVIACAVLVLTGAAAYRQYRDETKLLSSATNEYALVDSTIQSEFSQ
jgi:hypothetical protein